MTEPAIDELRGLRLDSLRQEAVTRAARLLGEEGDSTRQRITQASTRGWRFGIVSKLSLKTQHGNPWKFRWRGLVETVHITAKAKLHLRHEETGDIMKGWHSDKVIIRPCILRYEASVAPSIDDSESFARVGCYRGGIVVIWERTPLTMGINGLERVGT